MNRNISTDMTLGEIVSNYPRTREKLEELNIDYCCGGKRSLKEGVIQADRDPQQVLDLLEEISENKYHQKDINYTNMTASQLFDHIEKTHHVYLRKQLPRLSNLLEKVKQAHSRRHGEMLSALEDIMLALKAEIELHLLKEEQVLFPYIKQIEQYINQQGTLPQSHCGTIQNPIRQMEHEHDQVAFALDKIHEITSDYDLPEEACQTFTALYDGLKELELDLHQHIHLENNILFDKAIQLEEKMHMNQPM